MDPKTINVRRWAIAYFCCVAVWIACDAALQHWGFFFFENFMRLPLLTAIDLTSSSYWHCLVSHFPFWSVGTFILAVYAALGFLPLILVRLLNRKWSLLLTGAFVLAHPGLWLLTLILWLSHSHP